MTVNAVRRARPVESGGAGRETCRPCCRGLAWVSGARRSETATRVPGSSTRPSIRARLHPPQREDRTVLLSRSDRPRRCAVRQRRRRRPRRVPRPEPGLRRPSKAQAGARSRFFRNDLRWPRRHAQLDVHRPHGRERPGAIGLRDGRGSRRLRQRRLRGPLCDVARRQSPAAQRLSWRLH